ncbi:MAG: ABC transporter ATP-binding protein [Alkalilacustris sp.]
MTDPILAARGLFKGYGKLPVLRDVTLEVREGERHVIIGPNGAGKTTLFKVLSGELRPDAGTIAFRGRDITAAPGFRRVREGFGRSFQVARIFPALSVLDNLVVALEAAGAGRKGADAGRGWRLSGRPAAAVHRRAHDILEELGLIRSLASPAALLSHGDKKRLELAQILALEPEILFLDEPTAGMSPADRKGAVRMIDALVRSRGMTLVLTEHDMGVVFELGSRLTVLHYGEVVATGAPDEVRTNPTVREIYLGQSVPHG